MNGFGNPPVDFTEINEKIDTTINNMWDTIYPIGSIYMSIIEINPGIIFGGTWEQIEDKFLLCSGSIYPAGTISGSATHDHTLSTTNQAYADFIATNNVLLENYMTLPGRNMALAFTFATGQKTYNQDSIYAVPVKGNTDNTSNMPPYLAIYVWKRVA